MRRKTLALSVFFVHACTYFASANTDNVKAEVLHLARCEAVSAAASQMGGLLEVDEVTFGDSGALLRSATLETTLNGLGANEALRLRHLASVERNRVVGKLVRAAFEAKNVDQLEVLFRPLFAECASLLGHGKDDQ